MQRLFITGANRGIGLELVRQYAEAESARVFAACRSPETADALRAFAAGHADLVTIVKLDVTNQQAITHTARAVGERVDGLDILINNAGFNPQQPGQDLHTMQPGQMLEVLHVNTVAPLMLVQAFVGLLRKGNFARIINISSNMASLENRRSGGSYAYCASKAALNMVTRVLAADLKDDDITTVSIDPGWLRTAMGGAGAELTPEQSVSGLRDVIANLTHFDNGAFLRWDHGRHPW